MSEFEKNDDVNERTSDVSTTGLVGKNRFGEKRIMGFSHFGKAPVNELNVTPEEVARAEQGMKWRW